MRYYARNYPVLSKKVKATKDGLKKSIHNSTFESPLTVKELAPKKRGRPVKNWMIKLKSM